MKQILLFIIFICCHQVSFAQIEIPFSFISEDDNRLIKESDSGKYFVAGNEEGTLDTTNIVFLNEEISQYKLLTSEHKVLAEGKFSALSDKYYREGKWTEYYDNGKVKNTGYYYRDNPIGIWQQYYVNGHLKCLCSYSIIEMGSPVSCKSGSYQEYFDNGKIKTSGFYKAVIDGGNKDTIYMTDPVTNQQITKIVAGKPRPEKFGTWENYNELGALIKKDEY